MNAQERVLTTIDHMEPDMVPAFETAFTNNSIKEHYGITVNSPPATQKIPDNILKIVQSNKEFVKSFYKNGFEFYRRVGIDIGICMTTGFIRTVMDDGRSLNEDGKYFRTEIYKDGTAINGYVGGHFKNFEDWESWEPPDPNWDARLNHYLVGKELQEELDNKIFSIPALGALFEATWEGFGIESFSKVISRHRQAEQVFTRRGKFVLELLKILLENEAKLVLLWDDYGFKNGLFMNPIKFRKYVFPWIKRICDKAHKSGCKVMLHSDGDILEIFEDIIAAGVDVLNPIEPTVANHDYDIFKLHQKYGDKITFAGNLSPVMLANGDLLEIENYSKKLIRKLAPGGGYIFSSGHSINPAVTLDRFEAMHNVKRKFGKYPINIPNSN